MRPEDVGPLHNEVFDQISDMYNAGYKAESKLDLMMEVSKIMEGYCAEDDVECRNLAYQGTLTEFQGGHGKLSDVEFPDDFHAGLKESINKIDSTIKQINDENLDEIVSTIEEITNDIREMGDVNVIQQSIALSAASIASESTKLWHAVHFGEEDHPLRRLQSGIEVVGVPLEDIQDLSDTEILGPLEGTYDVISADIASGMKAGVNVYKALLQQGTASAIFASPVVVSIAIFMFAVPASTDAALAFTSSLTDALNPFTR